MEKEEKIDNKIRQTYFFKRGDGFLFATEKQGAWELLRGQGNWARRDFTFLGSSDGKIYKKAINESVRKNKDLLLEIKNIKQDITRYLKTEEKLVFEDVVPEDDEKLKRVKSKIKELEERLDKKEELLKGFRERIIREAIKQEVKSAMLNKQIPDNQDIITPGGDRKKILSQIKV